jgi:hypothetical protein
MLGMKGRISTSDQHPDAVRWCSPVFHSYFLTILITTDIPDKILNEDISFPLSALSMEILTGIRCVTFVKLPEALLAGIKENTEAVL